MRLRLLVLAAAMLSISLAARADIVTFNVNGNSTSDSDTIVGTIGIDTTTGVVDSYSVVAGGENDGNVSSQTSEGAIYVFFTDHSTVSIFDGSLVNYTGSTFTSHGPNGTYDGTISLPVSITPEPSSIALLGTGFLGLVGVVRRRLV